MTGATRVTACFPEQAPLIEALKRLRQQGVREFAVYSPVPLTEHAALLPRRGSPVRWYTLAAGIAGCGLGFALCIGASMLYSQIVGGKPVVSWVPFCVIAFELTILTAGVVTLGAVLLYSRLYPRAPSPPYTPDFGVDTFGISVPCATSDSQSITQLLQEAGADRIDEASP
jgi:hypothetical protein